jgi:hypothetical protein
VWFGEAALLSATRAAWRGGKGIPCRRWARGLGAVASVWMRRAWAAAGCQKNEDEANRSGDSDGSRPWARAKLKLQRSKVRWARWARCASGASAVGPMRGVRRSESMRRGEGREAESTHHRLRRYRRRVFLILPGPIWGMRQRHVDCERALEVEGCREGWPGRWGTRVAREVQ